MICRSIRTFCHLLICIWCRGLLFITCYTVSYTAAEWIGGLSCCHIINWWVVLRWRRDFWESILHLFFCVSFWCTDFPTRGRISCFNIVSPWARWFHICCLWISEFHGQSFSLRLSSNYCFLGISTRSWRKTGYHPVTFWSAKKWRRLQEP